MLTIAFTDFWPGFKPDDEWFVRQLRTRFEFTVTNSPGDADLVVASVFGRDHERFDCTRVLLCWENQPWPRARFDWCFSGDYLTHPRHLRLPLWVVHLDFHPDRVPECPRRVLAEKSAFAATVVSSPYGAMRNRLHESLAAYKPVASGGRFRNNVGGPVPDKLSFIRSAKFAFACEGSSHAGYTTEKLIQALAADTVPIYWGNPRIGEDFNTRRFVNYHDFRSERAFIDHIIQLDNDDDAYVEMLSQPWFPNGVLPEAADTSRMLDQFERIVSWNGTPVAQRGRLSLAATSVSDRYRTRQRFRERHGS